MAELRAADFRSSQSFGNLERASLVVEKIVVGAEEVPDAILAVEPDHLVGDTIAALDPVLALVVGRDRAVGAREFAAECQYQGSDRAVLADLTRLHGARCQGRFVA